MTEGPIWTFGHLDIDWSLGLGHWSLLRRSPYAAHHAARVADQRSQACQVARSALWHWTAAGGGGGAAPWRGSAGLSPEPAGDSSVRHHPGFAAGAGLRGLAMGRQADDRPAVDQRCRWKTRTSIS